MGNTEDPAKMSGPPEQSFSEEKINELKMRHLITSLILGKLEKEEPKIG